MNSSLESAKRPLRVAYILPYLEVGGAQQQLRELLLHLDRRHFQPLVIGFQGPRMEFLPRLRETGTPVELIPKRRGPDPLLLLRLARCLRRLRPDLLHAYQTTGNRYGVLAAMLARVRRRITSERQFFPWERVTRLHRLLDRALGSRTDRILANSRFVRENFSRSTGIPPGKIEVIYNGLEVERYLERAGRPDARAAARRRLGLEPGPALLGIVARLAPVKNHRMLLRAARLLAAEGRDFRLLVVGDGPLRPELEAYAAELGLAGRVDFLGSRGDEETAEILTALDVALLTSDTESLSNAIIEAMLCGRPVVATAVGGNAELVEEGETGLLVPPGDDRALAAGLRRLLEEPQRAAEMGRRGQQKAARLFGAREMARRTEEVYLDVLGLAR